jgi:hypothetical protein
MLAISFFLFPTIASENESLEPGDTSYNICFYQSKVRTGYTYYDCGSCSRIYDEQGKGTYSKCWP